MSRSFRSEAVSMWTIFLLGEAILDSISPKSLLQSSICRPSIKRFRAQPQEKSKYVIFRENSKNREKNRENSRESKSEPVLKIKLGCNRHLPWCISPYSFTQKFRKLSISFSLFFEKLDVTIDFWHIYCLFQSVLPTFHLKNSSWNSVLEVRDFLRYCDVMSHSLFPADKYLHVSFVHIWLPGSHINWSISQVRVCLENWESIDFLFSFLISSWWSGIDQLAQSSNPP